MGPSSSRIRWPPAVKTIDVLGEIKESSGRTVHRDNGHSISLGGRRYYVFGDTFCVDDRGEFVGVTNNTIAKIPDGSQPQKSEFLTSTPKVPEFIPYTAAEKDFNANPSNKKENRRHVIWNFSEVIEDSPGAGRGWIFYDKVQTHGAEIEYEYGTGVSRINVNGEDDIHVERASDDLIFGPEEPRFGSICTFLDQDGYVYLLGGKDWKTYLARIKHGLDFNDRRHYQFLRKNGWKDSYQSSHELHDLLGDQMHGAFVKFKDDKFAPGGKPYLWFGVNKWLDSKMWIGAAEKIDGPWDLQFIGEAPKLLGNQSGVRYCIYPHPWLAKPEEGKMMLSWTDNGVLGGIVGLAMLQFEMESDKEEVEQKSQNRDQDIAARDAEIAELRRKIEDLESELRTYRDRVRQ